MSRENMEERRSEPREMSIRRTLRLVERALREVEYGEVIINLQAGKVIFVDKHERERVG